MNVTQLRAFISVVDLGSFSEAARQLGVSQPAVTMQIKSLEAEVGATLLDRRYRRVELTEAGHSLIPHARSILGELAQAREDISALSDTLTGRLRIAASTTPGDFVVPRLLGGFLEANPQVQVEIAVSDSDHAIADVESGRAELGVCGALGASPRVCFEEFGSDELVIVCPPSHPLAGAAAVAFSALAEQDWVVRETGSGTAQVAGQVLASHGVDAEELRVRVALGSSSAVVSAVQGGLGIAIVSRLFAENSLRLGVLAEIRAEGGPIRRPFFTVLPKQTPTRAAVAFAAYLRDQISTL